ncbi:GNAT family N-acetyltransferase [Marivirga sp. S37H4]|uniref:GNAT family N-acetyltransferase n=1 Tax=Marivirga aurantiaca TaxID=2802615 RepID=A0A934WWJ5_9BACT|nr:GNAT family N-acetyltransferase [Marivirga aurantiaca]MBK6264195.1 GNAT family N-acetyltransferase [Marivirga aurantiaca]
MTEKNIITFRKALDTDIPYLLWLRKTTMEATLIDSGISVDLNKHMQALRYQFDLAKIILLNDVEIGMIKKDTDYHFIEIIQLQISPEYQGKGYGRSIIQTIIDEARGLGLKIRLSVLKKNQAIKLYHNMGFKVVDEDKYSFIMLR